VEAVIPSLLADCAPARRPEKCNIKTNTRAIDNSTPFFIGPPRKAAQNSDHSVEFPINCVSNAKVYVFRSLKDLPEHGAVFCFCL